MVFGKYFSCQQLMQYLFSIENTPMELLFSELNWKEIKRRSIRQNITQFVLASYSLIGHYMIWKLIGLLLNNDSPIVCVLSESMEPGFKRGDILFITPQSYKVGDIAVYQVYENSIPIVHRVIKKQGDYILTKGDNNRLDDIGLYRPGRRFLEPSEIRAGVFGYIPFFGIITVWINAVPGLKIAILLFTALRVFSNREDSRGGFLNY
ncbi:signal peptidase I [Vittaforma corneae ATCC 50505]|uniref:Signal peptidase complex catalytic subunit SEC11 n=1 Tax=Vittaforma corneae (strain ATCC 50505) TaxID=993615 RepID=L2GKN4_VITCO|nr:signal peptidase I [Vittaforma corneae ATCC 50505]ELA41179.1 signal peptidase I [Vittaforma corneae ATCC 50505]